MKDLSQEYQEAMELCEKKNKDYGNAKEVGGRVMKLMFPKGIKLKTADQMNEFCIFVMIMNKILRFANLSQKSAVTHFESIEDTLKDLGNYAFILKNMIHNNTEKELQIQQEEGMLCECGHREFDHMPIPEGGNVCAAEGCYCQNFRKSGE